MMTIESRPLRPTGISVIGDVPWGTHFCYFYETKQDLLDTLVLYFKAGLENKEFCLWVISKLLTVEEAKQALAQVVPDLDRYLAEGSLEIQGHDEWYLHSGQFDPQRVIQSWREQLNQALARGYAGLRVSGDTAWVQKDHWNVFHQYENELNALVADPRRIILCTYPLSTSPGTQIFDVARLHQVAVARRHGTWEIVETPELKQAKTDIKRLNNELEQKVEERTRELAAIVEALKKAEDRIRLVIDTIPAMAWSLRPDGVLEFINQRWLDYAGLSFKEAIEEPTRAMHPEELPRIMEKWLAAKAAGELFEDEVRLRRADGEYRWFLVRTAPLRDERGNIVKWYGTSTDIEDRKQAELRSRTLIDAIPHQIWSGPPDGTLDYCNERWRSYMGLKMEDARGAGWQAMLHPDDRDRVLKTWHEAVVNETSYEQEERHRRADGTYRWFLVRGVPQRDAEGRIVRWYGTNTDIEDRKQAEEALNAQALRYKTLMETSTDSIYVMDQKGNLQEANAAFLRRRGYTAAEVKGLNVADWDAQWGREELQERLRNLVGRSAVFETRHRGKADSVFDVEVCVTSVRIGGEQLFFCVTRDITGRKQAEERLRRSEEKFKTLFGIAPVGISVLDRQHNIMDANPALEKITRLSKEELLTGAYRRRSYLNADGTPKPINEFPSRRAVTENQPINDVETGIVTESGEIIWTQVSVAPLALPDASAVVITQDITERKRAEEALKTSNDQLRAISARLQSVREEEATRIAREIHDELGQKLTSLKMDLRRSERKIEELESSPALNTVLDTIVSATELVDEIVATVQEIAADLRPGVLDKLGLGSALQYEARRFRERTGILCEVRLPETEPVLSAEISTALFRIFQECLTNITRHAQATKVEAALKLEDGWITLRVQDNGRGITEAEIANLESLGLLGMKERTSLLGGEIVFQRDITGGTIVTARIPQNGTSVPTKGLV